MTDQTTKQPQMTPEETVKIVYLAKQAGSERTFRTFQEDLRSNKIPWSFTNERFLGKVKELKDTLIAELNLQNEELVNKAAEETFSHTLSSEEREGMMKGLDQIRQQEKNHQDDLLKYTGSLVDVYVKKLKEQSVLTPEQESSVRNSVSQATQQTINQGNLSDVTKQMVLAASEYIPNETASSASESLELPPEAQESLDKISQLSKITETALIKDEVDKGAFIKRCLIDPTIDPEIIASENSGELQAAKILFLSDDVKLRADLELNSNELDSNNENRRTIAFRQAAKSAEQGISKPINDVVIAVGGPQGKQFLDEVIDRVLGKSVKEIKENGTVEGTQVKTNALTAEKIRQMELSLTQREAIQKVSKSFFNEALVASAATLWGPQIQKGFIAYLETVTFKASINAPQYFHYFILAGTDVWKTIIGQSTKIAAGEAAKKAAGAFTGAFLEEGTKKGVRFTLSSIIGRVIGGIPGLILTGLSVVWGGIKGLFSGFGEIGKGLIQGFGVPAQKKPLWKDMGLVVGVVFIIVVFVIIGLVYYIRYAFTIAQFMEERDKTTTAEGGGGGAIEALGLYRSRLGGGGQEKAPVPFYCDPTTNPSCAVPKCEPDPNNPAKCEWAVSCGVVSQAPGQTGGSHSQNNLNAIDILTDGCGGHVDVHAIYNGVVVRVIDTFGEGDHDGAGGGYGNRVIVKATDKNGNEFLIMYAHLWYVAQSEQAGGQRSLQPGDIIKKGDAIGKTNNNGYSDIDHLHLEVRNGDGSIGGPNINQLLPVEVLAGCYNYGGKPCGITIGS